MVSSLADRNERVQTSNVCLFISCLKPVTHALTNKLQDFNPGGQNDLIDVCVCVCVSFFNKQTMTSRSRNNRCFRVAYVRPVTSTTWPSLSCRRFGLHHQRRYATSGWTAWTSVKLLRTRLEFQRTLNSFGESGICNSVLALQ